MNKFDPKRDMIRPTSGGAPQPPRPYKPGKQVLPSTSSQRLEAVPGKIDVVQFTGFPDIAKLDFSHYDPGLRQLFSKHIRASPELEEAIDTLILNLLVNSQQRVVRQGKRDYNRFEREYNRGQLMEYLRTIPCLEVVFGKPPSRIGNFTNKKMYFVEKSLDAQPLTGKYHLAYVDDNYRDSFVRSVANRKEQILETLLAQYVSQMETIECKIRRMVQEMGEAGKKEHQALEDMLGGILNKAGASEEQQMIEAIQRLQSKPSPGPFDEKTGQILTIAHRCFLLQRGQSPELEAEIRKIPSYEQILESVASCLEPKGILILNPAQERTFRGFKYIGEFGKVGVHQKVSYNAEHK